MFLGHSFLTLYEKLPNTKKLNDLQRTPKYPLLEATIDVFLCFYVLYCPSVHSFLRLSVHLLLTYFRANCRHSYPSLGSFLRFKASFSLLFKSPPELFCSQACSKNKSYVEMKRPGLWLVRDSGFTVRGTPAKYFHQIFIEHVLCAMHGVRGQA